MEKKSHHELETFFLFIGIALILPSVWFLTLVAQGKGYLVQEFIAYQIRLFSTEDAGHGGSFFTIGLFYLWAVSLPLFLPCFLLLKRWMTRHLKCTCLNSCEFFFG